MSVNTIRYETYKNHPIVATEYMHSMATRAARWNSTPGV